MEAILDDDEKKEETKPTEDKIDEDAAKAEAVSGESEEDSTPVIDRDAIGGDDTESTSGEL